jgi:DNA-binding GntR family transcriptional regulator
VWTEPSAFGQSVDELIQVQAMTARIACEQMTGTALMLLRASVERASRLPTRPGWGPNAAAHAEIFRLLADVAHDAVADSERGGAVRQMRDLMLAVGPAANGMIISSRHRLLVHLRAGDADGASLEMENHLRVLYYMGRLVLRPSPPDERHEG